MKLFLAVAPDGLSKNQEISALVSKLKRTTQEHGQIIRWVPPELWHVTLAFLGKVNEDKLRTGLDTWRPPSADLVLKLQGLGAFPESEAARVLWVGVQASQGLLDVQDHLARTLIGKGFALEQRAFRPHLTLGRFRNIVSASRLVELGGRKKFGSYKLRELILFASVLQGNILKYNPIHRWSLGPSEV